ncbi:MAG: arginyltransferase [Aquisalimonadaceae bacterium]
MTDARRTGINQQLLWLYSTGEHACSYLPDRPARTVFVDPRYPLDNQHYGLLVQQGMRRSGRYVYQPGCPTCQACKSLRIPVQDFTPNRSQRRCWKRNSDLEVLSREPEFREEHFQLYLQYLSRRHPGSGMDDPDPDRYMEFLVADWAKTSFHEIRLGEELLGVCVTDRLPDGLSAIYTYFHPDYAARSLGTWAILWQIEQARREKVPYVYLGYWIAECRKMLYKTAFRPCEVHEGGRWKLYHSPDDGEL